jgi:hypothetical protein
VLQAAVYTLDKEKRPASQRRLSSKEDQPPAAPSWTTSEWLKDKSLAVPKRAQAPEDRPQRLASSRLMPISMPREAINLIMAEVNVGAGTGANSGTATCV